jgi:hypothetical protein
MFTRAIFATLIMSLALSACTNIVNQPPAPIPDPKRQGITVLCDAGTGPGVTASIVVNNVQAGVAQPAIINPNSTTAVVCSTVNATAQLAGFLTDYSAPNATGLEIYGSPATIQVKCKEITLELQSFQPAPVGSGPITDCPQ